MENMTETENKKEQAEKELLELIKEAKNSDMTVGEFKEKLKEMEKVFGTEAFDITDPDGTALFTTPEDAFASWVYELDESEDKDIVKKKKFYPEVYFDYGYGPEEIWDIISSKSFIKEFDPYKDLPNFREESDKLLSKDNKTYSIVSNHERNWSQSLDSRGDSNGYVFPNEDEFMYWHIELCKCNIVEYYEQNFGRDLYEAHEEFREGNILTWEYKDYLKAVLGSRSIEEGFYFKVLNTEKEYIALEDLKELGVALLEEDEEVLHDYREEEYKKLKNILLSKDEYLDEDQEDRLVFLANREIDYCEEKGDRKALFSYLKDLDSMDLLSKVGQKQYEEMKEEFEPSQKPKRKLK